MIECRIGQNIGCEMTASGNGVELLNDLTIIVSNIISTIIVDGAKEFNTFNKVTPDGMLEAADSICDDFFETCRSEIKKTIKDSFDEKPAEGFTAESDSDELTNILKNIVDVFNESSDDESSDLDEDLKKLENALHTLKKMNKLLEEFSSDEE